MQDQGSKVAQEYIVKEKKKQELVAFDFDGTIIKGQSGVQLLFYLFGKRLFKPLCFLRILWWSIRYKLRLPISQTEVREDIFSLFAQDNIKAIELMMQDLYGQRISHRFKKDALRCIEEHRAQGRHLLIVSASFNFLIEPAMQELKFDGLIATKMKVAPDKEHYLNKVEGVPVEGEEKLRALKAYADKHFGEGMWELYAAYGDHYSDKNMLSLASHPCAVCPDWALQRMAKKEGWRMEEWS